MIQSEKKNIEEIFDNLSNIEPSESWDFVFEQKLQKRNKLSSQSISIVNIAIVVIAFLNIGFIVTTWKSSVFQKNKIESTNFVLISDELLISNP